MRKANKIPYINLQLHSMKNLDMLKQKKTEIMNRLNTAMKDGNEEEFAQAFTDFTENIQEAVMEEARGLVQTVDTNVLVGRGVRQLTSTENNYYQKSYRGYEII